MGLVGGAADARLGRLLLLSCLLGVTPSCHATPAELEAPPRTLEADGFVFLVHEGVTDADVSGVLGTLTESSPRVRAHLRVPEMPRIRVAIWSRTRMDDWERAMQAALGQVYPGATGYTPARDEMRLLLNAASPTEAVHEYAHLVSMQVNPAISNNPRWLWEAVAVYEAGIAPDVRAWADGALTFPGLPALNQYSSPLPYLWGFHIALAVIERWGDDGFLALIRSNGDLRGTLGITDAEFGAYVEGVVRRLARS
jgi:hypothetical protein